MTENPFTAMEPHQVYLTLCKAIEAGNAEDIDKVFHQCYDTKLENLQCSVAELYPVPQAKIAGMTLDEFAPPLNTIQDVSKETCNKIALVYPLWYHMLMLNQSPLVRHKALMRVPPTNHPLSILVHAKAKDEYATVARAAKERLGFKQHGSGANTYRWPRKSSEFLASIIPRLPMDHPDLATHLVDYRPNIRRMAALRLSPNSEHWVGLIYDSSSRVRTIAAIKASVRFIEPMKNDIRLSIIKIVRKRLGMSVQVNKKVEPVVTRIEDVQVLEPTKAEPDSQAVFDFMENI